MALVALWSGALVAQTPLTMQLASDDRGVAEAARRQLCVAAVDTVRQDLLVRLLEHGDVDVVRGVYSVLAHHGLAVAERRRLLQRSEPALVRMALPLATDAELAELVQHADASVRSAALYASADRGRLDDGGLVAALGDGDGDVAARAARLLVFERAPFPIGVLDRLDPSALARVLDTLAERPRAAVVPWLLARLARPNVAARDRLRAIAALPAAAIDLTLAREILRAAADDELSASASRVARRIPSAVADRLVGAVHAAIHDGARPDAALVCLENVTPLGERQVLALAEVLPDDIVEQVCLWLSVREAPGLDERVVAALDGAVPLATHLLRRAGPHLDRDARIARVVDVLMAEDADRAALAFDALAAAGVYRPAMAAFVERVDPGVVDAVATRRARVRALLRMPLDRLPLELLRAGLDAGDAVVAHEFYRALQSVPYPAVLEPDLLLRAERGVSGAAAAIGRFGSEAAWSRLWRNAPELRQELARWVGAHARPWGAEALRAATVAETDVELRREVVLARAALGDQQAESEILQALPELSLAWLRRCRAVAVPALRAQHVAPLAALLLGARPVDDAVRAELAGWLASRPDLEVAPLLAQLDRTDPCAEVREAARDGLLRGPAADELHARLRAAMTRPLTNDELELAYAVVGAAVPPVGVREIETIARLLLLAPLADARGESAASRDPFPRGADYWLHVPVVDLLRRDDDVVLTPFDRVIAELGTHPMHWALSARRVGHLLVHVASVPKLRAQLAPPLARATLAALDLERPFDGVAALVLAQAAEAAADLDAAAAAYGVAARELLRHPLPPLLQRAVLGEAAPGEVRLPEAALAARPALLTARILWRRGDTPAAREALGRARELAEGDAPTEQEIVNLAMEIDR